MERAALLRRLTWQTGTVIATTIETPRVKTIALAVPDWPGHRAGQHVDVRLTAPDGYQTQRSYSIASAPGDDYLSLTVERLDDGEVSPYLVDELREGDELEFRGPIGGHFVWDNEFGGPLFLVAGGSGVVPLRSMLRHHRAIGSQVPVRVLCSARSLELLIYREELVKMATCDLVDVSITLTREAPSSWRGYCGRIDTALLSTAGWAADEEPLTYVCGPTAFVETAAAGLVALGYDAGRIRTERFGGTGV
ncbi:ferredoxin reductase [Kribbella sp. NBC_00889]|uniref:ferredoxin reductase n=1 Tax=Kribbella sp. NBC_00889 TaxID=2975974 RepID=UPI00386D3F44|nr:ferredoxin reductase [Kribbella sp. NBC_00889]